MKKRTLYFLQSLLNSYAILFFSQNSVLGALLAVVSFFNPAAGLSGLTSVCLSLLIVNQLGFLKSNIQSGLYSFNPLLLGIGMGTFFHYNTAFWLWLVVATILALVVSVILTAWLGKYGLPTLSLPFILVFWLLLSAANGYNDLHLLPKESYMLNELSTGNLSSVGMLFTGFNHLPIPHIISLFFRSLSAVLFQDNVMAGIVISLGVFIHSRISFSLLVMGFAVACLLNQAAAVYPDGVSHYHLGVNFMMIAVAIGGFFLIPSWRSYVWAIVSIPMAFLAVEAGTKLLSVYNLPVLSLPFCVITLALLYFFLLRVTPGRLQLTPVQHYSPEANLYQYLNNQERLNAIQYLKLNLPFMGGWTVTQGYFGDITHKADWGHALDFVIQDEESNPHQPAPSRPEHYYCYGKPVLACADGLVEAVVNHVPDNPIGQINTSENWGNCVVIKHLDDLYSQVSHLKQSSIRVKVGDFVRQGDLLGHCGNSGRSAEPHLHFQVQGAPFIGSRTMPYPFAHFTVADTNGSDMLYNFKIPDVGTTVSNLDTNPLLKRALNLQPGYRANIILPDGTAQTWEVHTDSLNQTYLYSVEDNATAYFVCDGDTFYFTRFYGDERSLLFGFFLAAYHVLFSVGEQFKISDHYPLQLGRNRTGLWLQDMVAPFYQYIKHCYTSSSRYEQNQLYIRAVGHKEIAGRKRPEIEAVIQIGTNGIAGFQVGRKGKTLQAQWHTENIY